MLLRLRLEGGGEDTVPSLVQWLASVARVVGQTDDGVTLEAYTGGGAPGLLPVIAGWWRTRRQPMRLTISTEPASVTIEVADPEALAQVVDVLIGTLSYPSESSPPEQHPGGFGGPPGGPDFPTDR